MARVEARRLNGGDSPGSSITGGRRSRGRSTADSDEDASPGPEEPPKRKRGRPSKASKDDFVDDDEPPSQVCLRDSDRKRSLG